MNKLLDMSLQVCSDQTMSKRHKSINEQQSRKKAVEVEDEEPKPNPASGSDVVLRSDWRQYLKN